MSEQDLGQLELVSNENGVVTIRIGRTGEVLPFPQAMPRSRVIQLIDGHIRAKTRGPQPGPQAQQLVSRNLMDLQKSLGIGGEALSQAIVGGAKGLEGMVHGGGQAIRSAVPAMNALPSAQYQRPEPPVGPMQEAGAVAPRVAAAVGGLNALGLPKAVAGAVEGAQTAGRSAATGWKALPPQARQRIIDALISAAGVTGAGAILKKMGALD